jgi:outer membrane biosynthesis protein TonB
MSTTKSEKENKHKAGGLLGVAVYSIGLLCLLLFLSLKAERMDPDQGSMEMALGMDQAGFGEAVPVEVTPSTPPPSEAIVQPDLASNAESDVVVNTQPKKTPNPPSPTTKPSPNPKPSPEPPNEFDALMKGSKGGASGQTQGSGNEGRPDGRPGGGSGGTGGKGYPGQGALSNGDASFLPHAPNSSGAEGIIKIKVCINRKGEVGSISDPYYRGSTATSMDLKESALRAAQKATFASDPNGPDCRTAILTFDFRRGSGN